MSHPHDEGIQQQIDKNPFASMVIEDSHVLSVLEGRQPCPKCNKSRKFFCYTCYIPIEKLKGQLPQVKLPIKIDIIKHKHEIDGKSTSGHAAILAPEDVKVYTYPNIPDYKDERVVLVFPSFNAISISDLVHTKDYSDLLKFKSSVKDKLPNGHNPSTLLKHVEISNHVFKLVEKLPVDKVIFIDSTWNQSKGIFKDPNISRIPCVVIENRVSQFWRHQKGSPRWYLATIEAMHQFLLEIHLHMWGLDRSYRGVDSCFNDNSLKLLKNFYSDSELAYKGQYDNLLYFFKHMYNLIHEYYNHEELYAYKRRLM